MSNLEKPKEEPHTQHFFHSYLNLEKSILLLGKVIGGIDYYAIDSTLLTFGHGEYELITSDIGPRLQGLSQERRIL